MTLRGVEDTVNLDAGPSLDSGLCYFQSSFISGVSSEATVEYKSNCISDTGAIAHHIIWSCAGVIVFWGAKVLGESCEGWEEGTHAESA